MTDGDRDWMERYDRTLAGRHERLALAFRRLRTSVALAIAPWLKGGNG